MAYWYFGASMHISNPFSSPQTKDFAQLIRSSTTAVGLNMISYQQTIDKKPYECIVFFAVFSPFGNIDGEFERNVVPIIF